MSDRVRTAIVLAAGGSTRMGRPKALLGLRGRPVVAWHVDRLAAIADRVLVVAGADLAPIRAALPAGAEVVENARWATTGQADSLRLALDAADVDHAVLVTPVDVLPPAPATLAALVAAGAPAVPVGPDGRPGHPVLLDAGIVERLRREVPAGGLRSLLEGARRVPVADPLVAEDFDDPEAWERLTERWRP